MRNVPREESGRMELAGERFGFATTRSCEML